MNDDNKKILEAMERIETGQKAMQADISGLKSDVSHIHTALKVLPARGEVEEIVETTVNAAKNELRADILNVDAKVTKLQKLERRLTNLEDHAGLPNPNKN